MGGVEGKARRGMLQEACIGSVNRRNRPCMLKMEAEKGGRRRDKEE